MPLAVLLCARFDENHALLPTHVTCGQHCLTFNAMAAGMCNVHVCFCLAPSQAVFLSHQDSSVCLQAYEINNALPHLLQNDGKQSRIHLIFDAAERSLSKPIRLRPGQQCVYTSRGIHC